MGPTEGIREAGALQGAVIAAAFPDPTLSEGVTE
jgi:hypothetical protein